MKNMKESENIEMFLKAAEKIGMKRLDMFQVCVLFSQFLFDQRDIFVLSLISDSKYSG